MRRRRIGLAMAAPVLVLAMGALGACGRSSDGSGIASANGGATPTASASAATTADMMKYTQCMRDNGVDMADPDPTTGRPDFDLAQAGTEKFQQAMEKCRNLLPNGGARGTLDAAQIEQLRVFAQCMRDHGVDMPDPDPNSGGMGAGMFGGPGSGKIDRNSPTFQKAMEACQDKLAGIFPSMGARS